ncbi:MAG TPA: ABC transporter substrate-binding protein [Actinomycetota bacterium]|nr:ABC transporter substrate-binding protein [Actinomycetota bacterium]
MRHVRIVVLLSAVLLLAASCGGPEPGERQAQEAEDLEEVRAGWVSAIDQIGLPAALDLGYFEEHGLSVELAQPFPTGVDALNALQAGEVEFVQVGTPTIGAILEGMDLVYLGNYTGSSTQLGIDETMALVAAPDSGIDADDLSTLEAKRIGVSIGSINHLYMLGVLRDVGLQPDDVRFVNTDPPDIPVAIRTGGLDAAAIWDPWPIITTLQVEGAEEIIRGGGHLPFIGYIVTTREYAEQNPDVVEGFLAARAQADHWMRQNPDDAAEVAVRWVPGTEQQVAEAAMQYNIEQLDPRFSACNYLALYVDQQLLLEVGAIEDTFDVNEHFLPGHILAVMEEFAQYFEDLTPIPEDAQISEDYRFDPQEAQAACPGSEDFPV